jgi:BTB/POZ domain-containing protein 9
LLNTRIVNYNIFLLKMNGSKAIIDLSNNHTEEIESFLDSGDLCDVIFVLNDGGDAVRISGPYVNYCFCYWTAHKTILALKCEYFRAMFYGGLSESNKKEIPLNHTPVEAFKAILVFIYTGKLNLQKMNIEEVLEVIDLSNQYGFDKLKEELFKNSSFFKPLITLDNVVNVYIESMVHEILPLQQQVVQFIEDNAKEFLDHESFKNLPHQYLMHLLSRDSFFAPEIKIYEGAMRWIEENQTLTTADTVKKVLSTVRLPLIDTKDLINMARNTECIHQNALLYAIEMKTVGTHQHQITIRKRSPRVAYTKLTDVNVSDAKRGAKIIQGTTDGQVSAIDFNQSNDDQEGFTWHQIGAHLIEENGAIVIELKAIFIINHIKLHLRDLDDRSYGYYIECSIDNDNWRKVVDHSHCTFRAWQLLYFDAHPVKYIRIVGTDVADCHQRDRFVIMSIESKYVKEIPEMKENVLVANKNVASIQQGARLLKSASQALLNGNLDNGDARIFASLMHRRLERAENLVEYNIEAGFTSHKLPAQSGIVIRLSQPFWINSIRILLWDSHQPRNYSFYIESSIDKENWEMVVDKRDEKLSSWQEFNFPSTIMR